MRADAKKLKAFCKAVMESAGVSERDAAVFAENIVNADMRGVSSHGVTRLATYHKRCKMGLVDPKAVPVIETGAPSLIAVDGKNALGAVSASFAMEQCIARARETGACFATVRRGNHFGYAAFYAQQAAKAGMIGFAVANGPVAIPPIGGKEPVLGTSPMAVVIPAGKCNQLELDMATSVVARGKINLAVKEGKSIPEGWGIDKDGKTTTDPSAVKYLLPFGGAKGFGIGLIIEVLCSVLSGAKNAMTLGALYDFSGKEQDSGFFVGALDVSKLMPLEDFKAAADELFSTIKNSPKAEGVTEIFTPGEIEINKAKKAEAEGIEIGPAVAAELKALAEECGIAFDCEK